MFTVTVSFMGPTLRFKRRN